MVGWWVYNHINIPDWYADHKKKGVIHFMMISSKGRYALRVMIDLADRYESGYIPLREICERENISQKYLEGIMGLLSKGGLVEALHGKGGGYRLARDPHAYNLFEILTLTEGSLAPVTCLEHGQNKCGVCSGCRTLPMWSRLDKMIRDYFTGITLADIAEEGKLWKKKTETN